MRFRLQYTCYGDVSQQAIFMIPGWAMPQESMQGLAQKLSKKFYVVLVSLPGIRQQTTESQPLDLGVNYDIDALTEQLLEIAPKSSWWLGWSLGGMIATYVAARRSSRVKGLITMATTPSFTQRENWPHAMTLADFDAFAQLVNDAPSMALKRFTLMQTKGNPQARPLQKRLQTYISPLVLNGLALNSGLRLLKSLDVRRELQLLDCPNLHLIGREDALVPVEAWSQQENNNSLQSLHIFDECAHQPFLEQPELTVELIEQYIDAH